MRLLIDTHVFLWKLAAPEMLSETATRAIDDLGNDVLVSAVVYWEITIKSGLGKLLIDEPVERLASLASRLRFTDLPITREHAVAVMALPLHHRDPFDRMLVAQALHEELPLVTADRLLTSYEVPVLW